MIEWSVSLPNKHASRYGAGDKCFGRGYGIFHCVSAGKTCSDGSREGTASSVRTNSFELGSRVGTKRLSVEQEIASFLLQMAPFYHDVPRTQGFNATRRFFHTRAIIDFYTRQQTCLVEVWRDDQSKREQSL